MKLRRFLVMLLFAGGVYCNVVIFSRFSIYGVRPDLVMALVVSYATLMGRLPACILGCAIGLFMDAMYGYIIGLAAISYLLAAYVSGFLYQKYYADNIVLPALFAGLGHFFHEHLMALAMLLRGGTFAYLQTLTSYILPCALFTFLMCMPLHMLTRKALGQQARLYGAETHRG